MGECLGMGGMLWGGDALEWEDALEWGGGDALGRDALEWGCSGMGGML